MRIYLDANIIMEYLAHRKQFNDVKGIFQAAEQQQLEACVSSMSVDSVTYLLGLHLKGKCIHEPLKRQTIREMLNSVLSYLRVVDISQEFLMSALNDKNFKDIEDSYQYQCAIENDCAILITINTKDFPKPTTESKEGETKIDVLSPKDFNKKYMD